MMWIFSSPKLWEVGEHRVKKTRKKEKEFHGRHTYKTTNTYYKCVDCERMLESREAFLDGEYTCYPIVEE